MSESCKGRTISGGKENIWPVFQWAKQQGSFPLLFLFWYNQNYNKLKYYSNGHPGNEGKIIVFVCPI